MDPPPGGEALRSPDISAGRQDLPLQEPRLRPGFSVQDCGHLGSNQRNRNYRSLYDLQPALAASGSADRKRRGQGQSASGPHSVGQWAGLSGQARAETRRGCCRVRARVGLNSPPPPPPPPSQGAHYLLILAHVGLQYPCGAGLLPAYFKLMFSTVESKSLEFCGPLKLNAKMSTF